MEHASPTDSKFRKNSKGISTRHDHCPSLFRWSLCHIVRGGTPKLAVWALQISRDWARLLTALLCKLRSANLRVEIRFKRRPWITVYSMRSQFPPYCQIPASLLRTMNVESSSSCENPRPEAYVDAIVSLQRGSRFILFTSPLDHTFLLLKHGQNRGGNAPNCDQDRATSTI